MADLTVGHHGEITLPDDVRERYGFNPETALRVIETKAGVLLVPLHDGPMGEEFARELAEWQALGDEGLALFPYETDEA
jgi:bifunctional DNA-binding transcriptional regulator/antitoxin component of YhaV-PrlF toxin-antitoxin module